MNTAPASEQPAAAGGVRAATSAIGQIEPASGKVAWVAAGPPDQLSLRRLRQLAVAYFGEVRALDEHLALLDARGVLYAEWAMGTWSTERPGSFFGLVRHVVRTQFDGPAPDPDVEGWQAAGRPNDPELGAIWDWLREERYDTQVLHAMAPIAPRSGGVPASVARMDTIVESWPSDHFDDFVFSYVQIARVLERRELVMPLPPATT